MSIPSYITDLSEVFGFSSTYEEQFRAYLNLSTTQEIPDDDSTKAEYIKFLSTQEGSSLATYILAAISQYYGNTQDVDELALLEEFRASLGLSESAALTDTPDTRRQFVYFLSSPLTLAAQALFGISSAAADSIRTFRETNAGNPMADTQTTSTAYFSSLSTGTTPTTSILTFMEDSLSAFNGGTVTNDVLAKFRAYLGLTNSQAIPNDTATRAAFLGFMQEALASVQKSEAVNALSPQEKDIRDALWTTFSVILKMLGVLQRGSQVEAKSQQIYANWMTTLTEQISDTPLYGPEAKTSIVANDKDFGKTTLGYGNITVRDVLKYLMNQLQTNDTDDATYTIRNPSVQNLTAYPDSTDTGFPRFELQENKDGSYTFSIKAPSGYNTDGSPTGWTTVMSATVPASSSLITNQDSTSAFIEGLLTKMTTYWNSNDTITTPEITFWSYTRTNKGVLTAGPAITTSVDLKQIWGTGTSNAYVYNPSGIPSFDSGEGSACSSWADIVQYAFGTHGHGLFSNYSAASRSTASMKETIQSMVNYIGQTQQDTCYFSIGSMGTLFSNYDTGTSVTNPDLFIKLVRTASTSSSATFTAYLGISSDNSIGISTEPTTTAPSDNSSITWLLCSYPTGTDSLFYNAVPFTLNTTSVADGSGLWGPWTSAWPQTISYPSKYSKTSLQTIEANAQTYRGEVNAQLQLYLQSTQARQSTIETSMKNMQNLVSQTTQAATNQMNLLDSIIQTMTSILSALFH